MTTPTKETGTNEPAQLRTHHKLGSKADMLNTLDLVRKQVEGGKLTHMAIVFLREEGHVLSTTSWDDDDNHAWLMMRGALVEVLMNLSSHDNDDWPEP